MDTLQEFIFLRTYSRWIPQEQRREMFPEAVQRWADWMFNQSHCANLIPKKVQRKAIEKFLALESFPSMRGFYAAGPSADRNNAAIYNCSALAVNRLSSFSETLFLLMQGCGVGFSVEPKYIGQLPEVKRQFNAPVRGFTIEDSTEGWQEALDIGVRTWYEGRDVRFDYTQIRPMGTPLRTKGGRASGPDVLRSLLDEARQVIMGAQGRQLNSIECHDLMCHIAQCVVVGGVRRSAMISLSALNDLDLRNAKRPPFPQHRFSANNSAVYYDRPDVLEFLDEFTSLARSRTGERGIFNIQAARRNAPHRRKSGLIDLINPCGEVTVRDREFCNVTEFIVRVGDTFEDLLEKATTAAWIGTLQSTFTHLPNLPEDWKINSEDERLVGCSISGQYDNLDALTPETLKLLKQRVLQTTRKAAKALGINAPAAATCVKPSGTVSQLAGCSAGLHPRHSPFYARNINISAGDPLARLLIDQGVPCRPTPNDPSTLIVTFPVKSPEGAITRHDVNALDQLERYKTVSENWCEMNASCTINVREDEWLKVAEWVHRNWDCVNGLSFYPIDGANYDWQPYEEVDELTYMKMEKEFPKIDYTQLPDYEKEDCTTGAQEFACVGGGCDA